MSEMNEPTMSAEDKARLELSERCAMMARAALPGVTWYDISVSGGYGGLPFRLKVPDEAPGRIGGEYTFFDERDLRRLMLALAGRTRGALELRVSALAAKFDEAKEAVEKQAQALAELEKGLR